MRLSIELSPQTEQRVKELATQYQMEPQKFVQDYLDKSLLNGTAGNGLLPLPESALTKSAEKPADAGKLTGAQIVAGLRADGVIGAWKDREDITDSSVYARELRRQAETREW